MYLSAGYFFVMWKYEKGEHRRKHTWSKTEAGFIGSHKGAKGMCPRCVSEKEAGEVLNRGIPLRNFSTELPDRIYAVFQGVIYEAVPNNIGKSYHAYPWRGDLRGRPRLPRVIINQLEKQAQAEGTEKEFKKWLKEYGQ
jgi:hypothetical protein